MRKLALACLCAVPPCSCVAVDSRLSIRKDGWGALAGQPGVALARFSRTEDESDQDVTIHAVISFDRLESLASVPTFRAFGVSQSGGTHTLTQIVARAPVSTSTADTLAMVDSFFEGSEVAPAVEAPSTVRGISIGALSSDHLTDRATLGDLVRRIGGVVQTITR